MTRFAIVTPVRNAETLVGETIRSIIEQSGVASGRHQIDYIVCDGASDDRTAEIAAEVGGSLVRVISEPDSGMYDALAKGLRHVDGDIYFYLNAGDLLLPGAFDVVGRIFDRGDSDWLCGMHIHYSVSGSIVRASLPFRYRTTSILSGYYGAQLPHIQQESTFWTRSAMKRVDLDRLSTFKLAGDYFLWWQFAQLSEPLIVEAALGGFRHHGGHLGNDRSGYRREVQTLVSKRSLLRSVMAMLERPVWHAPGRVKALMNSRILRYSPSRDEWSSDR
ncbi:glycosyltransferase [Cryobacterium sp. TMT2-14]|uniref:glycosyltransferase n=1 Tax=Cryobacterium sp. TMT2-14 TaxID=1259245 RepID=UPI00106B7AC0|nr:glycosyltransferase [Cryobacterium sp. TMT2-14]TFC33842.1 glycosyltransferase [Cryobacterium sp. TMT2-14]